jgi:hypothetical protein
VDAEIKTPIKIALIGMDERSIARMATIFKVAFKGRCESTLGTEANLSIVDLDGADNTWETYQQQYPALPAIVMSESPVAIEGVPYVAKPAKLNLLWDCIFNLVTGLPPASEIITGQSTPPSQSVDNNASVISATSNKPDVSTAASAMDGKLNATKSGSRVQGKAAQGNVSLYFNPGDYLLGHIVSAIDHNAQNPCAIHVQCWAGRRLILLPAKGRAYTDLTDSQLKNLGVATINEEFTVAINVVSGADKDDLPPSEIEGLQSLSIEHLLWDLALRTARGRVPQGTDLSKPQYLRCWPNFPRLPRTPNGMRIAALWVENPRTLDDIASNLGIEKADVYSFHSAAFATGLVGPAKRQADNLIAPMDVAKNESSRRGLLASILRHLSN